MIWLFNALFLPACWFIGYAFGKAAGRAARREQTRRAHALSCAIQESPSKKCDCVRSIR